MRIAVVGTGIAGMVSAWLLSKEHAITVFEANDYVGGHTNTVDVEVEGRTYAVDTGFIVHNERTYPNFIEILRRLEVPTKDTSMSFSVRDEGTGFEYGSQALLAQPKNLLSPRFHLLVMDVLRFNREASSLLDGEHDGLTLGDYLGENGYSKAFVDLYIVPMGAAIWSTDPEAMLSFPAAYFVRFLENHGLTSILDRPKWRVIEGGSREYVKRLVAPIAGRIRTRTPIERLRRLTDGVVVVPRGGEPEKFDEVVVATHSDQALRMLDAPTDLEREVLGAIRYQKNDAVLHTDHSVLPRSRRAWSSWNYHVPAERGEGVAVTYDMSALQGIEEAPCTFCVSLNHSRIDEEKVIRRITYHHPLYTPESVAAQKRHHEISGVDRIHYCGAYWRYGFHEDGVVSALRVTERFGIGL